MNLDIIIVDVIVMAFVFVPYYIFISLGFRDFKELKNKFQEEAGRFSLQIDEREEWNSNILGLDRQKQKLLFVRKGEERFLVQMIDLKGMRGSRISVLSKNVKLYGREEELLQNVDLELSQIWGEEPERLKLFDSELSFYQDYEIKRAEKWNKLVNQCISSRPLLDRAA